MAKKPKLPQFERFKTIDEIDAQCKALGVPLNRYQHDKNGWDTIRVGDQDGGNGYVIYNTFNGTFFGKTPDKRHWHHPLVDRFCPPVALQFNGSDPLDGEAWFDALLHFFYVI